MKFMKQINDWKINYKQFLEKKRKEEDLILEDL